jgi:hypothetical protein
VLKSFPRLSGEPCHNITDLGIPEEWYYNINIFSSQTLAAAIEWKHLGPFKKF